MFRACRLTTLPSKREIRLLQYEQQSERDSSGHSAFNESAESNSTAALDVAASEADAATASAAAEPQSATHASALLFLKYIRHARRVTLRSELVSRTHVCVLFITDLRNADDESVNAQTAGSATVAVLLARSAASAEENVGSTDARPESGQ